VTEPLHRFFNTLRRLPLAEQASRIAVAKASEPIRSVRYRELHRLHVDVQRKRLRAERKPK
jgi:hypothetical protein